MTLCWLKMEDYSMTVFEVKVSCSWLPNCKDAGFDAKGGGLRVGGF